MEPKYCADFQTIVLKCVAEFPHERYSSAKELAEDLQRFLDDRTISASPPSLLSRAGKWAKRRRGVVFAAAAMLLVAFVGTVASMMMIAHEKTAERERALLQARDHLRQTHALLDRFATQLVDQLAAIPGAEGVRHELLQDCLELYNKFQREAVNDPSLATDLARAYSKLGSLSEKMSQTDQALDAHAKAINVWQKLLARDPSNAEYSRNLALCQNNIGLLMAENGRASEGLALLKQACQSQAALLAAGPDSIDLATDLATTHGNLGLVYSQMEAKAAAAKEFAAAIGIQENLAATPGTNEAAMRSLAASYNNFGSLQDLANANLAADAYQKAIAIQLKLVQADPINRIHQSDLARTYNNLGFLSSRTKDWKTAELCYADAIRLQEELVKASPLAGAYRRDLAISVNNLGMVQSRAGQLAEAESSFHKSARLQDVLLAAQPKDVEILSNAGSVWNNLGMLFDRQRRFPEAEKAYQQAIAYQRRAFESVPTDARYRGLLSRHYVNFVRNLNSQAKFDAAVQVVLKCKQLWPGQPERLYSIAQQLGSTYGLMRTANAPRQSQTGCLHAAVVTLREAIAAGLPSGRLKDPSLAHLADSEDFRLLLRETRAAGNRPSAAHQTALSRAN